MNCLGATQLLFLMVNPYVCMLFLFMLTFDWPFWVVTPPDPEVTPNGFAEETIAACEWEKRLDVDSRIDSPVTSTVCFMGDFGLLEGNIVPVDFSVDKVSIMSITHSKKEVELPSSNAFWT